VLIDELETLMDEGTHKNDSAECNTKSNIMMLQMFQQPQQPSTGTKLSELLTTLDNPFPIAKQVVVLCCNDPQKIDSRLLRPGRINLRLEYVPLTGKILVKMLTEYLGDNLTNDQIRNLSKQHITPSLIESYRFTKKNSDEIINDLIKFSAVEPVVTTNSAQIM
jgi:SpoVK/Ycf46/Vps4 family AAA+-type ATPase